MRGGGGGLWVGKEGIESSYSWGRGVIVIVKVCFWLLLSCVFIFELLVLFYVKYMLICRDSVLIWRFWRCGEDEWFIKCIWWDLCDVSF